MNNCERIKLQAGDWIKLSDIPNEQVFNLVKGCFINAGFNDCNGKYAQWHNRGNYTCITIGVNDDLIEFSQTEERQLSLSDIFNSVNGGWCWNDCEYVHVYADHVLYGDIKYPSNPPPLVSIKRIQTSSESLQERFVASIPPKASQWWDYEKGVAVGLPPVDTECEYSLSNGRTWYKCKVISQYKLVLHCPHLENDDWNGLQVIGENEKVMFRPLDYKTPKQIAVDKALDLAAQNMSFEVYTERLYEAGLLRNPE